MNLIKFISMCFIFHDVIMQIYLCEVYMCVYIDLHSDHLLFYFNNYEKLKKELWKIIGHFSFHIIVLRQIIFYPLCC